MTYRDAYGRFTAQPKPGNAPAQRPLSAEKLTSAKELLASRFGGTRG